MPTTPAGTPYTTYTATPAGGDQTLWAVADSHAADLDVPLMVYCHGSGGGYNQFATLSAWSGTRNWLIDNGWAWVESAGGGGTSWANLAARASYQAAVAHVRTQLDVGPIVVLGRSMGGLISYWLATQSAFAADCVGLMVSSGTTDLAYKYNNGGSDKAIMRAAYGAVDDADFWVKSAGHDPMLFDLAEWNGTNVLQVVGSADTQVVPANHGLAIRELWAGRPAIDRLDVRDGGDHSTTNGTYLQTAAYTTFLTDVTAQGEPVPSETYTVVAAYLMGSDGLLREFSPVPS